jgi:hypothetical protein
MGKVAKMRSAGFVGSLMSQVVSYIRKYLKNILLTHLQDLGYSSATVTAQGSASLTQRATHHEDAVVHRLNIAEPGDRSLLHEEPAALIRHCLGCNIIFCLWIFLAVLSLVVGLWRSYKTSDEGKGFTDAAYVVAVGGLIIFPVQNRHSYVCKRK